MACRFIGDHTTISGFHDCYVTGVTTHRAGTQASIVIICPECEKQAAIVLEGLVRMKIDNFLKSNIVLSIDQYAYHEMPQDLLVQLLGRDTANFLNPQAPRFAEADQLILFELEPSYGCTILALCKSISVVPLPDNVLPIDR